MPPPISPPGGRTGVTGDAKPRVAVVGGGLLGGTLALRLAQAGARVTLLERESSLGGLAGDLDFDGHTVDRFYHLITPSDSRMIEVAEELGIGDKLRFRPVGAGYYADGGLHDLDGVRDVLRFATLTLPQRARLAWFVALCRLRPSYASLERLPLQKWLRRHCGAAVTERVWNALLDSRFEGDHAELPATYLWARTRSMGKARARAGQDGEMGHLVGGHQTLIDAMVGRLRRLGAEIRVDAPVEGLEMEGPCVTGVRVGSDVVAADLVITTDQPAALKLLLPERLRGLLPAYPERWLGVTYVILKLPRSLMPYHVLNICEPTPITSIVETSHVVGTGHTDGLRLVYLPRYCDPDAPDMNEDDACVYDRYVAMVEQIVPGFSREEVVAWTVQRARYVEPVHALGQFPRVAPVWPGRTPGLALAGSAQIYPRPLNGDAVLTFAEQVAGEANASLGLTYDPDR